MEDARTPPKPPKPPEIRLQCCGCSYEAPKSEYDEKHSCTAKHFCFAFLMFPIGVLMLLVWKVWQCWQFNWGS